MLVMGIVIAALAVIAIVSTVFTTATDGYGRVPTANDYRSTLLRGTR